MSTEFCESSYGTVTGALFEDEDFDPEEAKICLECPKKRCMLEDGLPCRRYSRAMRDLRRKRAAMKRGGDENGTEGR